MAETPQDIGNSLLDTADDGKQLDRPRARVWSSDRENKHKAHAVRQAAALLLMPAPVRSLADELDRLSALGPYFFALNTGVRFELMDDPRADHLRATLMKFNMPMNAASKAIRFSFVSARCFYIHNSDEVALTKEGPGTITKEMVTKLLEPNFQAEIIRYAIDAATAAAKAAKIIREKVIPCLPRLEEDLEEYVDDYESRVTAIEERQKSWVPSVVQDVLWGSIASTPWSLKEVQELPNGISEANNLLRQLPAFLDNLELHFQRLSELDSQQILDLGYTNVNDLTRLYQDRLLCNRALGHMVDSWFSAISAFSVGTMTTKPKLSA